MNDERRKIINEISYLESTYCMNCPRLNKNTNQNNRGRCRKQRNNIQCVGCPVYDAIRERGNKLELVAQKDTFKKVRERYLNDPYEYLQHKEYPIELIIKELDITRYELRRRKKQKN